MDRRRTRKHLGEFLREIAALVIVFVPLESAFSNVLTANVVVCSVVVSGGLLTCGILLESRQT
jgi:hypothetical protein